MTPNHAQHRRAQRVPRWAVVLGATVVLAAGGAAAGLLLTRAPTHRAGAGASQRDRPTTTIPLTTTTPPKNPVTIAAVGDTELGDTPDLPPDPSLYLQPVESALSAQVVFGNLEGTLTDATGSKCAATSTDCFAFRTPPTYAAVLKQAGFTVLNSANNHSHDFGAQGVADTSAALQLAGITQTGLPGEIGIVTVGTTRVAFVAFAPYSNVNNMLDFATAKGLIAQARSEADLVVVYMHAGAEGSAADHVTGAEETYVGEDRGNAKAFAHAAIDDGADLVIASGPHVLRGMEFYNRHLIDYSMGDFASYNDYSASGDLDLSGILKVTLDPNTGFVSGQFISVVLTAAGRPSVDPSGTAATFVNHLSAADFGPDAATILANGTISPPAGAAPPG